MPRPSAPLTPASSTEIKGQDDPQIDFSQVQFTLPPSAYDTSRPSSSDTKTSDSSYHPPSPKSLAPRRKQPIPTSTARKDDASFALPPPPSRSRKIIQMKPKPSTTPTIAPENDKMEKKGGSGKKAPSATSAAGRKMARKTAHSLIERRRRSKMNEEFGVLKDMIPACTGEMHKLAILQASIDYVRYLENCISTLKAQNNKLEETTFPDPPAARRNNYESEEEEEEEDIEMTNVHPPTTSQSSISPISLPTTFPHTHSTAPLPSLAETLSQLPRSPSHRYSYSSASTTSPAFGPQRWDTQSTYAGSIASYSESVNASPALKAQVSEDVGAAALLMLGVADRRGSVVVGERRGMSVRDLLA